MTEKKQWGGVREGQGRPKGSKTGFGVRHTGRIVVSCTEEEAAAIREMARQKGVSVSELVVKLVLKK